MDKFVNSVYDCTLHFPKEEIYRAASQLRRASLSAILNYIEGYARPKRGLLLNFLEISYGSLKESKYLIHFSYKRSYINKKEYEKLMELCDKIGAMLWGTYQK